MEQNLDPQAEAEIATVAIWKCIQLKNNINLEKNF